MATLKTFVSPQTGSVYTVANTGKVFVSYRSLGNETYRVRVQGDTEALKRILKRLPLWFQVIKDGDHISAVVEGVDNLANCVADAVRAVVYEEVSSTEDCCDE